MRTGFITMEKHENRRSNSVGSSRIRAAWLWKYWNEASEWEVGREYDVLIFQKAYWRSMMAEYEGIKIFDLCDPDWLDPKPVIESMQYCDAMVTSTPALAEYLQRFVKDKPVVCIPDRIDLEEHTPRGEHKGDAKKIVWFGYSQNFHYLDKTLQFLIDRNMELTVLSNAPFQIPVGINNFQVKNIVYEKNWDVPSVHENIKNADLVLLPQTSDDDYRGKFKSNNKTLTAWALGLPVVSVPDDLERFISADVRNKERELRLKEIAQMWDVKLSVEEYKALIKKCVQSRGAVGERLSEAKSPEKGQPIVE